MTKFCVSCGQANPEGTAVCSRCGKPLSVQRYVYEGQGGEERKNRDGHTKMIDFFRDKRKIAVLFIVVVVMLFGIWYYRSQSIVGSWKFIAASGDGDGENYDRESEAYIFKFQKDGVGFIGNEEFHYETEGNKLYVSASNEAGTGAGRYTYTYHIKWNSLVLELEGNHGDMAQVMKFKRVH